MKPRVGEFWLWYSLLTGLPILHEIKSEDYLPMPGGRRVLTHDGRLSPELVRSIRIEAIKKFSSHLPLRIRQSPRHEEDIVCNTVEEAVDMMWPEEKVTSNPKGEHDAQDSRSPAR